MDATVDGVLGGYGHVNDADVAASDAFLTSILAERFPAQRDAPTAARPSRHLVALGSFCCLFLCIYTTSVLVCQNLCMVNEEKNFRLLFKQY